MGRAAPGVVEMLKEHLPQESWRSGVRHARGHSQARDSSSEDNTGVWISHHICSVSSPHFVPIRGSQGEGGRRWHGDREGKRTSELSPPARSEHRARPEQGRGDKHYTGGEVTFFNLECEPKAKSSF